MGETLKGKPAIIFESFWGVVMDFAALIFAPMTESITAWIIPMLLTVVSSIITILMLILAGSLIVGLIKGGDFLSMNVGTVVGKMKRSFDDYGEGNEYQGILREEKQKMHTAGLRARARKELGGG